MSTNKKNAAKLEIVAAPQEEVKAPDTKALFLAYDATNASVLEAERKVLEAEQKRSEAIKAISEANGGKKAYRRGNAELTLCRRGDLYFFRTRQTGQVIEVE